MTRMSHEMGVTMIGDHITCGTAGRVIMDESEGD